MTRLRCLSLFFLLAGCALLMMPEAARAEAGDVRLTSTSTSGTPADNDCLSPRISADGRYMVFASRAANLVAGITSGRWHIYRKDLVTGETRLCSRSASGAEGNGNSEYPDISADGSFVVFHSYATNLIDGTSVTVCQVYRKDMRTGDIVVCSSSASGARGNMSSQMARVSHDGRYVAFQSNSTNLVPGLTSVLGRIYRKDLASGAIEHCSCSSSEVAGDLASTQPAISSDGRYVAFHSDATNLIDGSTTSQTQVFRRDVVSGQTALCSSTEAWAQGNASSYHPDISADGRYVAFYGRATNLVSGVSGLHDQAYRKDLQTGQVALCSRTLTGTVGNNNSTYPSISADGRYVAFSSLATNLSSDANTGWQNVLRKDVSTGEVVCCSVSASGVKGNNNSYVGNISPDGRFVSMHSDATNLVDGTTTSHRQVLLKELKAYTFFYFAEGYTGDGFQEYLCLGNPGTDEIIVVITYLFGDAPSEVRMASVPAGSRTTLDVNSAVGAGRDVSIRVSCEDAFVAERPIYFRYGRYGWTGGHDAVGASSPSTSWFFAEGYTGPGFDQWVCVLNPGDVAAMLTFRFQTQEAGEVVRTGYGVNPHSRATFKVNDVLGQGYQASLHLQSDQPVVAERPMYFDYAGTRGWGWDGGHCVMGAPWLGREYFFAEGYTGSGFEEWLTLQNPNPVEITVEAGYYFGGGLAPLYLDYRIPAGSRRTVYVPYEVGTNREVSVRLGCDLPFLAERPMYFDYAGTRGWGWDGGHCVIGAGSSSSDLFFAEGCTGPGFEQWLCIQNPGTVRARVRITYFTQEAGPLAPREEEIPAQSRATFLVNTHAGPGYQLSCRVEVLSGSRVVAERPMYFDFGGRTGGHDVVGFSR